ncbi:hypothetical protein ABZS66_43785 [Dactylosporangium sp. NPDC005572]|uniref:hypothetical protein n=1 Tax=Dactylosporangium sp. NPDC005572 TaxID=3156889 RepID=UPI0033AF7FCB
MSFTEADCIASVRVRHRFAQEPLHPLRGNVSSLLRESQTGPGVHIGQQPEQERTGLLAWLDPTEPARDTREPRVELLDPPSNVYAVPSGRRAFFIWGLEY